MSWEVKPNTKDEHFLCYCCDKEFEQHVDGKCLFGAGYWRRGRAKLRLAYADQPPYTPLPPSYEEAVKAVEEATKQEAEEHAPYDPNDPMTWGIS